MLTMMIAFGHRPRSSTPFTPTAIMVPQTPVTLSLKGLRDCATEQEAAIQKVLDRGDSLFTLGPKNWVDFWRSVWGRALDPLDAEKDLNPFDVEDLGFDRGEDRIGGFTITSQDPFNPPLNPVEPPLSRTYHLVPTGRHIMKTPPALADVWGSDCDQFLIRSKYEEAEKAALSACGKGANVFTVTGHPGICLPPLLLYPRQVMMLFPGKTVFLCRLLIRRLSLGLPTALQIIPEYALLVRKKGVYRFERLGDQGPYVKLQQNTNPRSRIWALIDSNADLMQPAGAFTKERPFLSSKRRLFTAPVSSG